VLNVVRRDLPEGWRRGTFNGYLLSWDPTVVARLREWHESGRVELQWLTTWTDRADQVLAEPMGLPRGLKTHSREGVLPTGFGGAWRGLSGWGKLAAAQAVAEAEPRPDGGSSGSTTTSPSRPRTPSSGWPRVLVVAPDFVVGLTHAELDCVDAWLDDRG
jgi:hypothetical protein